MKPVTLVYSYCDQKEMLAHQYATWAGYPQEVKDCIRIIVVDDCSRQHKAADVPRPDGLFPLSMYHVDIWAEWGWPLARNAGMHEASDGWCLLTDLDHVLTAKDAVRLLAMKADPKVAYRVVRRKPNGEPWKRHNDTYLLTRKLFWKTGGYSLRFLGWYGTSSIWSRRLALFASIPTTDAFTLTVYNLGGEDIGGIEGAGVRGMGRKGSDHHVSRSPLAHLTGNAHLWPPVDPLAFPYHEVTLA